MRLLLSFDIGKERGPAVEIAFEGVREYEPPTLVYYGTVADRTSGSGATSCDSSNNATPGIVGQSPGMPSGGCGDAQQTK